MYGERLALKSRLDELNHAEERIIRQFREERESIYARLRKLDEEERFFANPTNEREATEGVENSHHQEENIQELVEQAKNEIREEHAELIKNLSTQLSEAKEIIEKLSKKDDNNQTVAISPKEMKSKGKNKNQVRKLKKNEDSSKLYEEALTFLKNQTASVQSVDIKKEVEHKTGVEITNMTIFMNRLMKLYPNIQKPYRGQYIYQEGIISNDVENPEVFVETQAVV